MLSLRINYRTVYYIRNIPNSEENQEKTSNIKQHCFTETTYQFNFLKQHMLDTKKKQQLINCCLLHSETNITKKFFELYTV